MNRSSSPPKTSRVASSAAAQNGFAGREFVLGLCILSAFILAAVWQQDRSQKRREAEEREIQKQMVVPRAAAETYRQSSDPWRWKMARLRIWAKSQVTEPQKSWAKERVRLFEALVSEIDRQANVQAFEIRSREIDELCAAGKTSAARALVSQLPAMPFPSSRDFQRLQREIYEKPLSQLSRRSPETYRALQQQEPAVAKEDIAALRTEVAAGRSEQVTPQQLLKVELLSAVLPADDPLVSEWSAQTTAMDFFEEPDAATANRWRRAQQAIQLKDWPTAVAQMQEIIRSKVRTRQPFRVAFGRALLRNPSAMDEQSPSFVREAAEAGDKQARAWMAGEEEARGRLGPAMRWLEAAVDDGDKEAAVKLLELYEKGGGSAPSDRARETGILHKISTAADPSAEVLVALGRYYENSREWSHSPKKALACYLKAAKKGQGVALAEVARCVLRGVGTAQNFESAVEWACQAYATGERARSVPILIELMQRAPDVTAVSLQRQFEQESVATPAPYNETRLVESDVAKLRGLLARHLDQKGLLGPAARWYAQSGDSSMRQRHAAITATHRCATCVGSGKVQSTIPCLSCGGKGSVTCGYCTGNGYVLVPGSPPCAPCSGSGTVQQDRKSRTCPACSGTGKGMGSVIRKTCPQCVQGEIVCADCTQGRVKTMKDCLDCQGRGTWTLAERKTE